MTRLLYKDERSHLPLANEGGSITWLLVVVLITLPLLTFRILDSRYLNETRAQLHEEYEVDKIYAKTYLTANIVCRDIPSSCVVGKSLNLVGSTGKLLVAREGGTKIGAWNVKVECPPASGGQYWVTVASFLPQSKQFARDPLTDRELSWQKLATIESICGSESATPDIMRVPTTPCYGYSEGSGELPSYIKSACGPVCTYSGKYCMEEQRDFAACPENYSELFRYTDRYGWGGIDFTKYTMCKRN